MSCFAICWDLVSLTSMTLRICYVNRVAAAAAAAAAVMITQKL